MEVQNKQVCDRCFHKCGRVLVLDELDVENIEFEIRICDHCLAEMLDFVNE